MEYIIAGLLSSKAAMWLDNGDRNLLKLVVYMRATEAVTLFIVHGIQKLMKMNQQ